jgi:hypothetical protein
MLIVGTCLEHIIYSKDSPYMTNVDCLLLIALLTPWLYSPCRALASCGFQNIYMFYEVGSLAPRSTPQPGGPGDL